MKYENPILMTHLYTWGSYWHIWPLCAPLLGPSLLSISWLPFQKPLNQIQILYMCSDMSQQISCWPNGKILSSTYLSSCLFGSMFFVCLNVCFCLFVCMSVCLFVYMFFVCMFVSICLFVFVCLSVCLFPYFLFVCLFVCLYVFVCLHVCLFVRLSVCLFCLFVCMFICLIWLLARLLSCCLVDIYEFLFILKVISHCEKTLKFQ